MTTLMVLVSDIAIYGSITAALIIYWCVDRVQGYWILANCVSGFMVNNTLKLAACVYRPWIRDPRIVPPPAALKSATGYSFPSGHTQFAASFFGSVAIYNRKKYWQLIAPCIFCILLTGFSRNYLGVHTPQDVFVGICISVLSLILTAKLFAYLALHPEKENMLLLGGFVFCCLALVYITVKPYPMTLNEEGALIVDPQKMMNDGYGDLGKMMGFLAARYVEKTWIRFKPLKKSWKSVVICLIGLALMIPLKKNVSPIIVGWLGSHWGKLLFSMIYVFYYIALFPLILKLIGKQEAEEAAPAQETAA